MIQRVSLGQTFFTAGFVTWDLWGLLFLLPANVSGDIFKVRLKAMSDVHYSNIIDDYYHQYSRYYRPHTADLCTPSLSWNPSRSLLDWLRCNKKKEKKKIFFLQVQDWAAGCSDISGSEMLCWCLRGLLVRTVIPARKETSNQREILRKS